ncbi:MAG: benzoate-CoA ligase family protein [Acidobacteria bacterium]|nr:benzoate-CoA ligase family protein [Acidobacteriota bacterium]
MPDDSSKDTTAARPLVIPEKLNIAAHYIDRAAELWPGRIAIAGEPAEVRYAELAELVNRAGNALRELDCNRGDRVLIVLPDSAEFVAAFFGAAKIGAVAVPVNPMTRADDYAYYLRDSGAKIAVVHEMAMREFVARLTGAQSLESIIVVGAGVVQAPTGIKLQMWKKCVDRARAELKAAETSADDMAFFLYTSGSGGQPKGVVHRHKDMLATTWGFAEQIMGIRAEDRCFSVSKLYFAYGLGNGVNYPFSVGASAVYNPERPRPEKIFGLVKKFRPTIFFSVPTVYAALLREASLHDAALPDFSSVRLFVSAGEALPVEILEQWNNRFGAEIVDAIGSTEMLHMFISNRPGRVKAGTCGTPVAGCEARIVNEDGEDVKDGEIGNLLVRGGAAFAEYWNKPELTARTRVGDWVVTGDKFLRDSEGYYVYCGRADDMMKVSGLWVAPAEVENAVLGHPEVAEAAVVGALDENGLTRGLAFVVPKAGVIAGPNLAVEILAHTKSKLAAFKCPAAVKFVEELPKTATGKIQRFKLRET